MNILVTGAAGFIGSHLCDRLLADGHSVVGLDNFEPFYPRARKEQNIARARSNSRFKLVESDIRGATDLEAALAKSGKGPFDAIVHLAGKAGVRPSIEDPVGYQVTNVLGTQNTLEYARKTGVRHVVYGSSSSVYGVNPDKSWREDSQVLMPISPYASSKVSGELLGHVYSHLYGIRFIALRFFTVYGERQRPDLAIHKFARLMLEGKPIPFFGSGSTRRDYTHVKDIVTGIVGALQYHGSSYEVINLGNNRTVSLSELVNELSEVLKCDAILDHKPEQPGDVPWTCADLQKATRMLNYRPQITLRSGLTAFAQWLASTEAAQVCLPTYG